ncbi:hypothetical protein G647_02584 [Cladophialophora carrionii CBS 160.54]|uniref:DUF3533 domain-containing protein n=1 Tax=Cladophialophora carrionii CBS 160.54 TaxID=1279043 RepID=V9DHJ5_9EURO|nr:uncharacterized protein G647_02584 [Cladophialophora carrionii CBS 160.54]ETI25808.1 hypothetical protein G647_02584 [Cladophialophora carrionii CBS 160.54]
MTMDARCHSCGQRRQQVEHDVERAGDDGEIGFAPDTPFSHFPEMHDAFFTDDFPTPSLGNFFSLSNSTIALGQSSLTLALTEEGLLKDAPEDVEQVHGPARTVPVGFFDSRLSKTRVAIFKKCSAILAVLCVFVLTALSIYWGVLFRIREKSHLATIAVVNFDASLPPYDNVEPIVGLFVEQAIMNALATQQYPLGYKILPPAQFNNDPLAVRLAVHKEQHWGAIIVNNNATALLREAVEIGNASYDPFGAASVVITQARNADTYNQYITPVLTQLASDISFSWGREWTSRVLTNTSLSPVIYANAPQVLSPGIGFSMFNLRPFGPSTAVPPVSMGLVYLIILAFFSFGFFTPIHMRFVASTPSDPHPPLKFSHLVVWRYVAAITTYFFLSLCYSLVSLAFQIPLSRAPPAGLGSWPKTDVADGANQFGHGTFPVYWMLNFFGMGALGLACENMAMIIGQPWTALWLVFWVVTNVSTAFYSVELAPSFYRWGYAWPLRQIVYATRTLIFGTNSRLALNFGILGVWMVLGTILFPFASWFMRWKGMREKKKKAAAKT